MAPMLLRIKRKNVVSVRQNFIPKFTFFNVIGTRIGDDMILSEKNYNLIYITSSVFDNPKKALFLTDAKTKTTIRVFGFDKENLIGADVYAWLLRPYELYRYVPAYDKEIEGIVFVCAGGITFSGYRSLYDVPLYSPYRPDITIGNVVDVISKRTSAKNFIYRITNESNSRVIVYTSGLATYIVDKGGSRDIVVPVGSYLTLYSEKEAVINIELYLD